MDSLFERALRTMTDAPGIIIDLRANGGGQTDVTVNIASLFFDTTTSLGGFRKRGGIVEGVSTHESHDPYNGPLVILVDEGSASASEVFAASLSEHHRATIVGRQTCGCVLNQWSRVIKGGGTLGFSAREYTSPGGRVIEGVGITPDRVIPLTIADLRSGRDAALEEAVRILAAVRRDG